MAVRIHPHVLERAPERGTTEDEIIETVEFGIRVPAKLGRTGSGVIFHSGALGEDATMPQKQVEAYAVREDDDWLVIAVVVKFF